MVSEEHTFRLQLQDIFSHPSSKIIIITEPDSDDQCHPASDFVTLFQMLSGVISEPEILNF